MDKLADALFLAGCVACAAIVGIASGYALGLLLLVVL